MMDQHVTVPEGNFVHVMNTTDNMPENSFDGHGHESMSCHQNHLQRFQLSTLHPSTFKPRHALACDTPYTTGCSKSSTYHNFRLTAAMNLPVDTKRTSSTLSNR